MQGDPSQVTRLLQDWRNGRQDALEQLAPIIHRELHRLASSYMRGQRVDHPLQPTALVNEAYIRLLGHEPPDWRDRAHFLATAAHIMRHVLVDFARRKGAAKRDFGRQVTWDDSIQGPRNSPEDVIALNDSLDRLAEMDPRRAKAIELRFFGGLSLEETAEAMASTVATVRRDVALGCAWLRGELTRKANA